MKKKKGKGKAYSENVKFSAYREISILDMKKGSEITLLCKQLDIIKNIENNYFLMLNKGMLQSQTTALKGQ